MTDREQAAKKKPRKYEQATPRPWYCRECGKLWDTEYCGKCGRDCESGLLKQALDRYIRKMNKQEGESHE